MKPLTEDTIGDKLLRFVLGALLGGATGWLLALQWRVDDSGDFGRLILGTAGLIGVLAVLFGNAFIEWFVRGRWWGGWWR